MPIDLQPVVRVALGQPVGQCRVAPVRTRTGTGPDGIDALLAVYAADFDVDPYVEMFFFPTDTLKMSLIELPSGRIRWTRDLGRGTVPGLWFCPVFPFDLDGDGVDEVYLVDNPEPTHPLGVSHYRLCRLNPDDGAVSATRPWPAPAYHQPLSHVFRFFLMGGHVDGRPVLVSTQGTYGPMAFQGWRGDLEPAWETQLDPRREGGALGSHMCPVLDLDGDGDDELLWGERCLSLRDGKERWRADADTWHGHSDLTIPVHNPTGGAWSVFTARESEVEAPPRVVMYDAQGNRRWSAVDRGHMDLGWCARVGPNGETVAVAIRIDGKTCGPDGRFHAQPEAFAFDAETGAAVTPPFDPYGTLPVDLTGDGTHELVYGLPGADGRVIDRTGESWGQVDGVVAAASKLLDRPGEQLVTCGSDGTLSVWANRQARDTDDAQARYAHPAYRSQQRLTATGYNLVNLGGV